MTMRMRMMRRLATGNPLCIVNPRGSKMMRILLECNYGNIKPSKLHLFLLERSSNTVQLKLQYCTSLHAKITCLFCPLVLRNEREQLQTPRKHTNLLIGRNAKSAWCRFCCWKYCKKSRHPVPRPLESSQFS